VRIKWLYEARAEFRELITYYRVNSGPAYARQFSEKILGGVRQLERFPELGVQKETRLLGKYGFRALFISQYVCVYRIDGDTVYVYHLADARTNYLYHIFGMEDGIE